MKESDGRLLVQIASYNTNLQGNLGIPQDLVDWLSPTLQVSSFLSREQRAPDIVAVGFQELLPLHLGLAGRSTSVINSRASHILSEIEAHAPNKERYALIAKAVNVGVALLVYGRDDGVARNVAEVQTQYTGCGPMYMGNKGAVGVRFGVGNEVFTFVCAHLTAHTHLLDNRIQDYHHIVGSLLFPSPSGPTTIYSTSHLFFLGDLNFRLSVPSSHPLSEILQSSQVGEYLMVEETLEKVKEYDQLLIERKKSSAFVGLREGEFWKFKCTYKYELGEVVKFSPKRTPAWTDRILYATYSDSPDTPNESHITDLLYTSIPSYTTSDHKPIVSLLLLPAPYISTETPPPQLRLPPTYNPAPLPHATLMRRTGRALDRLIGHIWWILTLLGAGNIAVGMFNIIIGLSACNWWFKKGGAINAV